MASGNLQLLKEEFFNSAPQKAMAKFWRAHSGNAKQKEDYAWLLRHHSEGNIKKDETWLRDDVDYLLSFYSILEIALLTGYIEVKEEPELFDDALVVLEWEPVLQYYSEHYRLALPSLLRERLRGRFKLKQRQPKVALPLFMQFLPLTRYLEEDEELESFLWIMDGGNRGYDFTDLRKVLRDNQKFAKHFFARYEARNELDKAVQGFVKFLDFCVGLDKLLLLAATTPQLQAEMFGYHSYWFIQTNKRLGSFIVDSISNLGMKGSQARETERSIGRLFSGVYGKELEKWTLLQDKG